MYDIVAKLKQVALELGRVPTRDEFIKHVRKHEIDKHFGSYTALLHAAGLQKEKKKDLIKRVFDKDINSVLLETKKSPVKKGSNVCRKIMIIGDTHFPFVDHNALTMVYTMADMLKPDVIVQIGDLYDMFAQGRFPRSLNNYNPFEEMELGFKQAKEMWEKLRQLTKAECYQILGNHDIRPIKKVLDSAPEVEPFLDFKKWFRFDGVTTNFDTRQELEIDGIIFIHGYKSQLGQHRDHNLKNTVCGHSHLGGVSYRNHNGVILYELNAGFIGDPNSKALGYTPQKITRWTQGIGFIDEIGPRFIPF